MSPILAIPPRRRQVLAGIGIMALGMSFIGIVDGGAKYVAQSVHGVQVAWAYFLGMLLCLITITPFRRLRFADLVLTRHLGLQLSRAFYLVCSLGCFFASLSYLPLAEATIIGFTQPLFVALLAGPILGERVGWQRWTAVVLGLTGAALVVRPGSALFQWAAVLPLVGAVFFAMFGIVTKQIGSRDREFTTLFYTFFVGTLLLSLSLPLVWTQPGAFEWKLLAGISVLGALAHQLIVRATLLADASVLAPLNYARLLWAIGIGVVVFDQRPDLPALIGAGIIVCSGLYVVYGAAVGERSEPGEGDATRGLTPPPGRNRRETP